MERIIEFRAKLSKNGQWVKGSLIADTEKGISAIASFKDDMVYCKIDADTIGQNTNCKDAKGNWIYEGDILSTPYFKASDGQIDPCAVAWSDDGWDCTTPYGEGCTLCTATSFLCYIIGNVHDHPEMMKMIDPKSEL